MFWEKNTQPTNKILLIGKILFSLWLFIVVTVERTFAAPPALTYQGRILKSDGSALEFNNVSFQFKIMDPSGSCLIYHEQVDGYDMTNSNGVFDVPIGQGVISYPTTGSLNILDAFNNLASFTCSGGSTYNPLTTDGRVLRVSFYDGVGWKTINPDNRIRSVPYAGYALSAQKLGDKAATDFLTLAGIPTCSNGSFLTWNGTSLSCSATGAGSGTVTNVSSANTDISVATGTSTPVLSLNTGVAANQIIKLDATAKLPAVDGSQLTNFQASQIPNLSAAKITSGVLGVGQGGTGQGAFTNGQILIGNTVTNGLDKATLTAGSGISITNGNGSITIAATGAGGTVTDVSSANGDITVATGTSSPVLTLNSGTAANQIVKLDTSAKLPAIDGSQLTNLQASQIPGLDAAKITSGTFSDAMLSSLSIDKLLNGTAKYFNYKPNNVACADNEVLKYDTTLNTGNGGWKCSADNSSGAESDPTVQAFAKNAPSIGLTVNGSNQLTVSYGSAAGTAVEGNDARVTGAFQSSTALGGDLSGTLPNPVVEKIKGQSVSAVATATGQVLRYDGTAWTPNFLSMFDLRSTITGAQAFGGVGCLANQTLTWTSATDNLSCTNISISNAQVTGLAASATTDTTSATNISSGTLDVNRLPSSVTNALWTESAGNVYRSTGNVGIGTTTPSYPLSVAGIVESTSGGIRFPDGSVQITAAAGGALGTSFMGSIYTAKNPNCVWTINSTTSVPFETPDADCNTPTLDGAALAPSEGLIPAIRFANIPAGRYILYVNGSFFSTTAGCEFKLSDGNTDSGYIQTYYGNTDRNSLLIGEFNYPTSQASVTFKVKGNRWYGSSTCGISVNDASGTAPTFKMSLYRMEKPSESPDNLGNHVATQNVVLGANYLSGDGDNEGIKIDGNGSVGIGTTTPGYKLDVAGDVNVTGNFKINGVNLSSLPSQTGNAGKVLQTDGTNVSWVSVNGGGVGSSMIDNWPDAIKCDVTNPNYGTIIFHPAHLPYSGDGLYYYRLVTSSTNVSLKFNSDGSFNGYEGLVTTNCNASISTLYNSSQAFNLNGGSVATSAYGMAYRTATYDMAATLTWYPIPLTGGNSGLQNISHSTTVDPERMTVSVGGTYEVTVRIMGNGGGSAHTIAVRAKVNGTTVVPGSPAYHSNNYVATPSSTSIITLSANDYVTLEAYTDVNITNEIGNIDSFAASMVLKRLGP